MSLLLILSLLGLASCVYTEQCPPREEQRPCTCYSIGKTEKIRVDCIGFSTNGITVEDIKEVFKNLQGKKIDEMVLFHITLGRLSSDFFKGLQIRKLRIEYCNLQSVTDGDKPILAGLENSLKVLIIESSLSDKADLSKLRFAHLKKLEDIIFYENEIKEISNAWFENGPASLKFIDIINSKIEKIGDRIFADLPNLAFVLLFGSKIRAIERGMFPKPALHLEKMYFAGNALENLPEDIFTDMPALTEVGLESNAIFRLEEKTWKPVWEQLNYLNLQGNDIICDSHTKWLFELRVPRILFGYCSEPDELSGVELKDYILKKGQTS